MLINHGRIRLTDGSSPHGNVPRIAVSLLTIAVAILSVLPLPGAPEGNSLNLQRGIEYYLKGDLSTARFYRELSGRKDDPTEENTFLNHKLGAFVALSGGDIREADKEILKALEIREDPYLHYILALHKLRSRNLREARFHFLRAASARNRDRAGTSASAPALYSVLCPDRNGTGALPLTPFRRKDLWRNYWNRTLREEERLNASFQALTLGRAAGDVTEEEENAYHDTVLSARETEISPALKNLLTAPDKETNHLSCMDEMERSAGTAAPEDPTRGEELDFFREMAHRNRIAWIPAPASYTEGGNDSFRRGSYPEALYRYRRALHLTGFETLMKRPPEPGTLSDSALLLRKIASCYERLGYKDDARAVARLARALERHLSGDPLVTGSPATPETLRNYLRDRSGEFPDNREGLLLRIEYAKTEGSRRLLERLEAKLRERDRVRDLTELISLFGPPEGTPAER